MYLVKNLTKTDSVGQQENCSNVIRLREAGCVLKPENIKTGGYYIYKEKFGMACLVKVLKADMHNDLIEFRLMVKQVLYSPWDVAKGRVFEVGCNVRLNKASWHFERGMSLVKCEPRLEDNIDFANDMESAL